MTFELCLVYDFLVLTNLIIYFFNLGLNFYVMLLCSRRANLPSTSLHRIIVVADQIRKATLITLMRLLSLVLRWLRESQDVLARLLADVRLDGGVLCREFALAILVLPEFDASFGVIVLVHGSEGDEAIEALLVLRHWHVLLDRF